MLSYILNICSEVLHLYWQGSDHMLDPKLPLIKGRREDVMYSMMTVRTLLCDIKEGC